MKIPLGVEPKFGRLVRHLERWAAAHALSYRLIVMLLALVGYAYLMGALLLLVAAAGAIVFRLPGLLIFPALGLYVFAPFFVLGSIIVSALWVRIEAPGGYEVTHETAPALFALLDKVRRAARAPRVPRGLITEGVNSGTCSLPPLGGLRLKRQNLPAGDPHSRAVELV